jgi:hypothetical protein
MHATKKFGAHAIAMHDTPLMMTSVAYHRIVIRVNRAVANAPKTLPMLTHVNRIGYPFA